MTWTNFFDMASGGTEKLDFTNIWIEAPESEAVPIFIEVFGIDKVNVFKEFSELKQIDTEYRTDLLKEMNEQYPSTFNLWEGNKFKSNILKYKKDYNYLKI